MTSTKSEPTGLVKTDCIGRVRVSKEHREQLLDSFEKSPLSGTKFAALHGVNYQTFATWVQKRKRERGEYESPAKPPSQLLDSLIELELP
ncbi:MAG: IS66 family insertion sequence element accessory protein TnpA, partial [Akkermansiaceae bacterium]